MVSACANSSCRTTFRLMHTGRIFRFDFPIHDPTEQQQDILWDANGIARRTELFWLCEQCSHNYTLVQDAGGHVMLKPLSGEPSKGSLRSSLP